MKRLLALIPVVLLICGLATGCARRELEDRSFPTALTAKNADLEKQEMEKQEMSSKFIDYGHVKAVILSEAVLRDSASLKEVLLYLENRPVFARNILLFAGDEKVLEIAGSEDDKIGMYLEDLCKNQPPTVEFVQTPLKDMLNYLHNGEASIVLPKLKAEAGKLLPDGSVEITQEAAATMNSPIPRKTTE